MLEKIVTALFLKEIAAAVTNIVAANIRIYYISRMPDNGPEQNDNIGVWPEKYISKYPKRMLLYLSAMSDLNGFQKILRYFINFFQEDTNWSRFCSKRPNSSLYCCPYLHQNQNNVLVQWHQFLQTNKNFFCSSNNWACHVFACTIHGKFSLSYFTNN